ncbi:lipase 1 [Hypoxylon sp. FL1284]|nr:lipase 1 [Hypoxylon sp. FL1284]
MASSAVKVTSSVSDRLVPSKDPWYTTPDGFEASTPGTVLRIRTAPGEPTAIYGNAAAAYQILYRTTGSRYQPTWAVTSLLIPKKASVFSGQNALMSLQIPYNTLNIDMGPSYLIFEPPVPNDYGIPPEQEKIDAMLGRGWYVTIPDFEGPRAAFTATVQAGHATLDGIRAVLSQTGNPDIALPSSADKFKYAMWGYSGGSLASEKAAELQVQYTPELTTGFVGAALGGLVSGVGNMFDVVNKKPFMGNLVLGLLGIMREFPEVDAYLQSRLKTEGPQDAASFLRGREMQSLQAFETYAGQDIYEFFVGGRADLEGNACEALRRVRQTEWTLGYHGAPAMPLYVYKAIGDEMTPIGDTDEHVDSLRRYGVSVLYERNMAGNHMTEIVNGQDRAMQWLASVFDGSYDGADKGVRVRDVTVDLVEIPFSWD